MYKKTNHIAKKRLEKKIKKFLFFYFFPFFVFLIFFIFIFNSKILSIKEIDLNFNDNNVSNYLDGEEVKKEINNIVSEKYFYTLSKNNFIFFPRWEIKKRLKNKFPEISKVDISWGNWMENVVFKIDEEKESYFYCKNENREGCLLLNNQGKLFHKIETIENDDEFLTFISDDNLQNGEFIFKDNQKWLGINDLINNLNNLFDFKIKYFIKKNEYLYILVLDNDVKFLIDANFDKDNLVAKINKVWGELKENASKNSLVYVDFSLQDRVHYCLIGDECEFNY